MLSLFLSFAIASTVCADQPLSKHKVCVTMENAIRLNGKNCKAKGMEGVEIKPVMLKLFMPDHLGNTHEKFWQCTYCVECD